MIELSENVKLFLEDKNVASSSPTLPSGSPVGDIIPDWSALESKVGTYSGVHPINIKKCNKRNLILIISILKVKKKKVNLEKTFVSALL